MPVLVAVLLLGALIVAGWLILTLDPKVLARSLRYIAIGALVLFGLFLAARGAAALDLPLGALIVYLLHHWSARGFPGTSRLKEWLAGTPRSVGTSTIETVLLRMTLNQASGELYGEVIAGRFAGARLGQLGLDQLRTLLAECAASDDESARLLESYLDRMHAGWREQEREQSDRNAASSGGPMSRDEALQVLGLQPGASREQITKAHRRLMTKLHPDHGGTDYLASKINAARDALLNGL